MSHRHHWWPVPLAMGDYVCGCGVTGHRGVGGGIREHKKPRLRRQPVTVRPVGDEDLMSRTDFSFVRSGARVAPKKGAE